MLDVEIEFVVQWRSGQNKFEWTNGRYFGPNETAAQAYLDERGEDMKRGHTDRFFRLVKLTKTVLRTI